MNIVEIGSARKKEKLRFSGKAERKFPNGAEGTCGKAKQRGIFSAEAETSCNAEAKKGTEAEPRAVGSSQMMVFTKNSESARAFWAESALILRNRSEKVRILYKKGQASVRLPG
mgnify:CR=1 FL=1